jgi:hypothetical protein
LLWENEPLTPVNRSDSRVTLYNRYPNAIAAIATHPCRAASLQTILERFPQGLIWPISTNNRLDSSTRNGGNLGCIT